MNFREYLSYFDEILNNPNPPAPYNDKDYWEYTKLNRARLNRWLKQGAIDESFKIKIKAIDKPQSWIIITEPWCGDAAHIVPFIEMVSQINPLITTKYELRDAPPFRIEQYLSNGSKSIPILIVFDEEGNEKFHWGPRPEKAQELYLDLKKQNTNPEDTRIALQNWYNSNKGEELQKELQALLI